jgi:CheY-like chemotaxis protein
MSNEAPTPAVKRRRIMILEDERQLIDLFEMSIRDWFQDPDIVSFVNGNAAWEELNRQEPDMLIMDCSHPGLSGIEIMEQLAAKPAKCIILLTSELFEGNLNGVLNRGLKVHYLHKPFGIVQFWRSLNEHIGPSDFPERQALVAG